MIIPIAAVILLKIIDLCYLFQIKEYRFDRFRSMFFEKGLINTLYTRIPQLPARTLRNFLIMALSSFLMVIFLWLYLQYWSHLYVTIIVLVLSPVVALILMFLSVLITRPLAYSSRKRTVGKAVAKIGTLPDLISVGVSGTYGKTSTKEFLYQMLKSKYDVAKTDANQNTDVGVAVSVLNNITPKTKYFIAEVGAYRKGEVRKASQLFSPKHAIITGFGNQHLDLYGSRENLIEAESEILKLLPTTGTAYINFDILPFAQVAKRSTAKVVSFSVKSDKASLFASNIARSTAGTLSADIAYGTKRFSITTTLIGRHNLSNILPCIAFCMDQGMSAVEVAQAVKNLRQVHGKLSRHVGPNGSAVLNDSGNSSVDGFLAAINALEELGYRKNVIISKGIIELGKEKKSSYKTLISTIANKPIQLYTMDNLFNKYGAKDQVAFFGSEKALLAKIKANTDRSTLLVIEGKFTQNFINSLILL